MPWIGQFPTRNSHFIYLFKVYVDLLAVFWGNFINLEFMTYRIIWQIRGTGQQWRHRLLAKPNRSAAFFCVRSLLWGARAHQNRQSNEEGGDVNVAAERSDWSVRMNLSSLQARTEQHLSQRQPESLSHSPHQHTKDFRSQRAAQIQKDEQARKEA